MQVFGGHGFISEWGMEQYVRDARINLDLRRHQHHSVARPAGAQGARRPGGEASEKFGRRIEAFVVEHKDDAAMAEFVGPLADLAEKLQKRPMEMGMKACRTRTTPALPPYPMKVAIWYSPGSGTHGEDRPDRQGSGTIS